MVILLPSSSVLDKALTTGGVGPMATEDDVRLEVLLLSDGGCRYTMLPSNLV